jgi:hypothetical protein
MSRRKNQKINEPFVPILKFMVSSPAFKNLTNASRVAYLLLKCQCCKYGQDEVKFPYSDAGKYMDRHTFARSIRELVKFGFIEISSLGGLFRRTNIYRFSSGWKDIK